MIIDFQKKQPTGREKEPETFNLETICPNTILPTGYAGYCSQVKGFNIALFKEAQDVFKRILPELTPLFNSGRAALVAVGSDARHEKGIHSPIELVVVGADALSSRCLGTIINQRFKEFQALSKTEIFDPDVDIRNAGSTLPNTLDSFLFASAEANHGFSYRVNTCKQGNIISPNRLLDAKVFMGSPELLQQARLKMLNSLVSQPELLSLTIRDYKDKVNSALKICRTGTNRRAGEDIVHFDREHGELFYNGQDKLSLKLGPLRAIQQKLMCDMLIALRDGKISPQELLEDFINPAQSTNTRLSIIGSKGNYQIPAANLFSDYSDTYEFCLWLYHRSQQSTNFVDSTCTERVVKLSTTEQTELDLRLEFLGSLKEAKLFHIK